MENILRFRGRRKAQLYNTGNFQDLVYVYYVYILPDKKRIVKINQIFTPVYSKRFLQSIPDYQNISESGISVQEKPMK